MRRPSCAHLSILSSLCFLTACGSAAGPTDDVGNSQEAVKRCHEGGSSSQALSLELLGRYSTEIVGLDSSGETAALKDDRLFVTSAQAVVLDVVDVSEPGAPALLRRVDLHSYGASVQSVDVSSRGLVAVAVGGFLKTDPGTIVFLDTDGNIVGKTTVGALPDMVAFTPNGKKLVSANEGEPDCYGGPACVDPLGSVSIVTVSPMRATPRVTTVDFSAVELPAGVRVYGPGASAAQDLEPEGVTISENSRTAYVTLQENNAIAVIDLEAGKVSEVRALGYEDLNVAPKTTAYVVQDLPSIGTTPAGQELRLGGFSGLHFEGKTPDGKLRFLTHTDRGPNGEPTGINRPFLIPDFQPRIVRLEVDPATGTASVVGQIPLKRGDGSALTGVSNVEQPSLDANAPHNDEVPVDLQGNELALDPLGADLEGIVRAPDGTFWMVDEYRPAIYHFDATGTLIARLVPAGAHAANGLSVPSPGTAGALGIEALPGVLGQRRQNRGFEGVALHGSKLYAIVQSPLRNPASLANGALNAMKNVRLVELDLATMATRQFIYIMDNAAAVSTDDTRADKIGDMVGTPDGAFMILERDDDALPEDPASTISKKIYSFALTGATDITALDTLYAGKSLDQMTASELGAVGVRPIAKVLHIDLVRAGYANLEKVEGLAYIDPLTVGVVNDNDFDVAGIVIDPVTGTFTLAPGYDPEPEVVGIIENRGLDASDRDNVINIRDLPVWGMYQPDAITSYEAGGKTYLMTANEGDARDYPGYLEEARARAIRTLYPSIPEVSDDLLLGRLTVTIAPPGGDLSRPYVFGSRSFTIWDAESGAKVWSSGADLERRTAEAFPSFFNSNNDGNDFDNRSDNKGPEPEGIAVGRVHGRNYAFIALERIGGVAVYDLTGATPAFVTYANPRVFTGSSVGPDSGPEIVKFVPTEDSPTHSPLLVLSNEISGTVTIWALD